MNKVYMIGNLTRDPELRSTQMGVSVCSFSIAVNRRFKGTDGKNETDFFNVTAWRQLGELCQQYLAKGRKVAVAGSIQSRSYQAADGSKRIAFDIVADEVEFLPPAQGAGESAAQSEYRAPVPVVPHTQEYTVVEDEELLF